MDYFVNFCYKVEQRNWATVPSRGSEIKLFFVFNKIMFDTGNELVQRTENIL